MNINVCPSCKSKLSIKKDKPLKIYCSNKKCFYSKNPFGKVEGIPILIPFEDEYCILNNNFKGEFKSRNFGSQKRNLGKRKRLRTKILKIIKKFFVGVNKISQDNYEFLENNLKNDQRVLVIGGGTKGDGSKNFYKVCRELNIEIEVIDIYKSEECSVIADAHFLPYKNNFFNFVIIQAVLEHVAFPQIVVNEIHRVLKNNGIVYSEIPFLQNVHEGPFDFTRFTHSGHRLLFRNFSEIKSGSHQGSFSALLFIASNTISSFTRIKILGPIIRLLFSRIIRFLDNLVARKDNIDIACGTYLICSKKLAKKKSNNYKWITKFYKGNQS